MMRRTILLMATMALTLLAASGLALVAGIGSATADSSVVGPGESIQKAINAADPGDTIVVRGVHREDVVIRKDGIKLRGEDAVIEAPPRAKADSPCSKVFGPEGICVLGDVNIRTGEITGPARERRERFRLHVPGLPANGGRHIRDRRSRRPQRHHCGKPCRGQRHRRDRPWSGASTLPSRRTTL